VDVSQSPSLVSVCTTGHEQGGHEGKDGDYAQDEQQYELPLTKADLMMLLLICQPRVSTQIWQEPLED
jgi:hypothetical protein